ncbi:MAG: GNAT family N-acetyltransferase [Clostridiales bacterium]|uniref:GNAT family N-acetyltransferase n=1 Tax=Clostridium sp. N3C TaxID=1776758 RepID=UPI00092DEDBE|nr:GNAT family N-acetyltransferase [Clostridium sp. N3C]NLZ48379.1 GNAT family N-acetyltransferase [Clostridiales bacterium]SCN24568.1 putative acetyltransferase [Clostridium sp. N3C]
MDKITFVVREAIEEDITQIIEEAKEAFWAYAENAGITEFVQPLQESYEDLKRDLETKLVLVAILDGEVVGSVRVEINPDNTAYLSRLGVKVAYQNNGVGKILLNAVDNYMMKLGVKNLYLHTASRMFSLVRFYYGRGFYIESTTKDRGYVRALLCKEYPVEVNKNSTASQYDVAVV